MLISCSNCQSKIKVPDNAAGKKGKCPKCGTVITIPAVEPSAELPAEEEAVKPAPPSSQFDFEAPAKQSRPKPPTVEDGDIAEGEPPPPRRKSARADDEIE